MIKIPRFLLIFSVVILTLILAPTAAWAFCGFYVAKADTSLYNQASQVILARNGNRTVMTMANDYQGAVKDFALVVPVPVILNEQQVWVGNPDIIKRIDAFSAPRLVEYFDEDPCANSSAMMRGTRGGANMTLEAAPAPQSDSSLGVTIESQFTVGEYDILILSATESDGLETWLLQNGYKIPAEASQLLQPYIRQNMKFFVAKVNLAEFNRQEFQSLNPLVIAYESPRFMLPIRLGMVNAEGEQDLIVYLLSPKGEIELVNYRTVKIPSDVEVPEFVQDEFVGFYRSMFQKIYERHQKKATFLEYAWDMSSCDPCTAEPLTHEELKEAGVFWLNSQQSSNVFLSRIHARYTRNNFPEDLQFQETANRQFFQGRYVITHPYRGEMKCQAARDYVQDIRQQQEQEIQNLAELTNWKIDDIRRRVNFVKEMADSQPWWQRLR
ncbi:MAG: DUF2330 domain-containing protein [Microcoleaceae cyanobacterium]